MGIGDFFLHCTTSQRLTLNSFKQSRVSNEFDDYNVRVRYYWFYELDHI